MTIEDIPENRKTKSASAHNRFVMLAVLAFVAMVTVYLLKKNMEPPQGDTAPQQPAAEQEAMSQQSMEQMMSQIDHISGILAQDSTNYDAWVALGNAFYDANMPEEAIEHYEQALALQSDDIHVMTDLATMKRAIGEAEDAVEILRQVVAIDSTFSQAWFNLGVIHAFDLDDKRGAIDAWNRFLAVAEESPHIDAIRNEIKRMESEL
jgi:cytochrome c-type biogenesis protein CcmH/NrfG